MFSSNFLYGPYHDRIEFWLEDSFSRKFHVNKSLLLLYILNIDVHIFSFSCCLILQVLMFLIFDVHIHAGLKQLEWLHWKFHFT
jgi:hypothetical protein